MNPEKENKITYCITANCTIINSTDVLCSKGTRLSLAPCDLNWPGTSIASACAGAGAGGLRLRERVRVRVRVTAHSLQCSSKFILF